MQAHHDHGGTAIDAITINIDRYGVITVIDDADEPAELEWEHAVVLIDHILDDGRRGYDLYVGGEVDCRLNDHDYWRGDDESAHEGCFSRGDVYDAANRARSIFDEL